MLSQSALPEPWDDADGEFDDVEAESVVLWEDRRAERSVRAAPRVASGRGDAWEPPSTLRQRLVRSVSVPFLAGAVVFVAAIAVALSFVWFQPHSPPVDAAEGGDIALLTAPDGQKGGGSGAEAGAAAGGVPGSADSAAGTVVVHVVGAVNTPGVVELAVGSRVRDAVAGAGGATGDAVLAGVNLARLVVDGEQILVPDAAAIAEGGAAGAAGNAVPPGPEIPGASPGGALPVDLNTADLGALESLPRVGPALAQRILDWRAANGGFSSVDQLLEVPGIGAKTLEGFRDQVRVS